MRTTILPAMFMASMALADDPKVMGDIQSEPYTASGSTAELAKRAASCSAQVLRFDAVTVSDAGTGTFLSNGIGSQAIPGGDVIVRADPDYGVVVANSRVNASFMSLKEVIQSVVTIETKDDRFRIRHSDIRSASLNTGFSKNGGFETINPKSKFAKVATDTLLEVTRKLSECINVKADW